MENRIDAIYARQSVDRKDSKERGTEKKQVKKSEETGCPAISSRIAFGPIFIKEFCHLAKTIPQILAARCQLPLELPQPAVAVRYHRKNFSIIIILHACMYYKT